MTLERLYKRFAQKDAASPDHALATKVVNGMPVGDVDANKRQRVLSIIKWRKIAVQQTIMWQP